jgi:hypothetical protein
MNVSGAILQSNDDLRDVSGFQFKRALPIDHQGIIGSALDLLRFVVERILPHTINRTVAGHAFFGADISGLRHCQRWGQDRKNKGKSE